jgi:hypothetical protein
MKFIGMVFSAARAWLQAMTPAAATQKIRNIMISPPGLFGQSLPLRAIQSPNCS